MPSANHEELKELPAGTMVTDVAGDLAEVQGDGSIVYQFEPETEGSWEPWIPNSLCRFYEPFTYELPAPISATSASN